jgi:serralysin
MPVEVAAASEGSAGLSAGASGGYEPGPLGFLNADQRGPGLATPNGKPNLTIDQVGSWLTRDPDSRTIANANSPGEPGWGGAVGAAYTVTYAYRATAPATMPSDTDGFSRFNASQIAQAELALKGWSDVANISFVRIGSGSDGDGAYADNAAILMGNYSSGEDGAAAFGYNPGSTSPTANAGDVWINSSIGYNQVPTTGSYGAQVLLHELGHAIGLTHPGVYNADANTTFSYDQDAEYYEDSRQYTVMSYFGAFNTGADYQGLYAAAPQLDDIRAAQVEYGANMNTRTGDTVYGFNATADRPWFIATSPNSKLIFAVWDAGGNDTFDFSGYANSQVIDLRQGFFSSVGGLTGNVAIAQGATIENAIGGSGSNVISGNEVANRLTGGAGADTINAGAGADSINGGNGANYLRGDDGNDTIAGGSGFDDINGNQGADTAVGGAGNDWVVGGKDDDLLNGDAGDDIVYGNLGNDWCDGGDGADLIRGGQGNDVLYGQAGNDWLSGDRGNDTITGGAGADIFHGSQDAGLDRITDFNYAEGDRVLLDAGTTYTVSQQGADVVIDMGGGNEMILVGVQLSSLGSGWISGA